MLVKVAVAGCDVLTQKFAIFRTGSPGPAEGAYSSPTVPKYEFRGIERGGKGRKRERKGEGEGKR